MREKKEKSKENAKAKVKEVIIYGFSFPFRTEEHVYELSESSFRGNEVKDSQWSFL